MTTAVAARRLQMPIAERWAWLNHAGTGPLPRRHVEAAGSLLRAMAEGPPPTSLAQSEAITAEVRSLAARLMQASEAEIAVLSSTVQAINLVPLALDWRAGDEVVTAEGEFPSVLYSQLRLRQHGMVVREIPAGQDGWRIDDLAAVMTPRTRLVSLSLVGFATGWRAPAADVAALCRRHDAWLVLDAIQALGALDIDVPGLGADIVAAQGYKHLLSGYGVALCWCSPRARHLVPPIGSKAGTQDHLDATSMLASGHDGPVWTADARRFEAAVPSLSGLHGAAQSLQLLLDWGMSTVQAHIFAWLDEAAERLVARGWQAPGFAASGHRSSLLCLTPPPGIDPALVVDRLKQEHVVVSLREGRVRISPHAYNDASDLERLWAVVPG